MPARDGGCGRTGADRSTRRRARVRGHDQGAARMSTTRILADFLADARFKDLPPTVVADTERAVLDWLGSVLAGSMETPARLAQGVAAGFGQSDEATVFGAQRASALGAAFA